MTETIGYGGAALYLLAYLLVSTGRLSGQSVRFQVLNLLGAVGVGINAYVNGAGPSVVVNIAWFAIGVFAIANVVRARRDAVLPEVDEPGGFAALRSFLPIFVVIGLGVLVLIVAPRPPAPLTPIAIYTSGWSPYIDPSDPDGGPMTELVTDLLRTAGYEPEVRYSSWSEAQERVEEGTAFVAFPFIASSDRLDRFLLTDPVTTFEYALFYRDDGEVTEESIAAWSQGDGDPPGELGAVRGYELWPELEASITISETFETPDEAFLALANGVVDLVPEGRRVGQALLLSGDLDLDAATIRASSVNEGVLGRSRQGLRLVATRGTGAGLVDDVNEAIAEFEADGRLREFEAAIASIDAQVVSSTIEVIEITDGLTETGETIALPLGVRARVTGWPVAAGGDDLELAADEVRAKLLNGPSAGRVVTIDLAAITVVGGTG